MAYKSKFKGKEIDDKLDLVQKLSEDISNIKEDIKNITQEETDPVFSNSPASNITDQDINAWNNKQDNIEDLEDIREGASKGATAVQPEDISYVTIDVDIENADFIEDAIDAEDIGIIRSQIHNSWEELQQAVMDGKSLAIMYLNAPIFFDNVWVEDMVYCRFTHPITNILYNVEIIDGSIYFYKSIKITESGIVSRTLQCLNENGGLIDVGPVLSSKQNVIKDLQTIREGAAKGATALQEHQTLKTINWEPIIGEGNIEIVGGSADLEGYATEEYVNNAVESVNVKGEDGYVYSNGEKVDMRFTRSLIPVGTSIPAKANLNTVAYLKVGKYYCSLNVDAKTITNCPTANAFMMEVFNPLSTVVDNEVDSTYVYRIRILTEYSTGIQYFQYCTVGSTVNKWTYDSWYVCPRTKFTLNSSKNDGSAALGSATQGVYINAEGTFVKMSYTLGKSVPSSAVFTDTKVTAVGNHYTPVEDESVIIEAPDGEVIIGLKRDAAGHVVGVISTPMSGGGSSEYESNIEDKTLAMPNAVGGIAKGTTISALEGKTYNEMFDDLLFPTVNPTFTDPSASIKWNGYSSTQEVGATGPTASNFTVGYNAGAITLNGTKQANRGGAQDIANSFIYVNGSTSNKTLPSKVTLGSTTFKYRAAYAGGPQPKNNKGGDYSTPLASGTVDSSAITLNGTYPWYASTSSATSTNPVVKQSLVAWNTTAGNMSTGQFTVQPSGTLPQVFKLPRKLHTLQLKNALNGQMETVTNVSKDYTESTETINIGGTNVTYYVYTYSGSTRGSVTLLAKF